MLLLNFTGLSRTYWLPKLERRRDRDLWFVSLRWLQLEVVFYSRTMATEFIRRLNRAQFGPETDAENPR